MQRIIRGCANDQQPWLFADSDISINEPRDISDVPIGNCNFMIIDRRP